MTAQVPKAGDWVVVVVADTGMPQWGAKPGQLARLLEHDQVTSSRLVYRVGWGKAAWWCEQVRLASPEEVAAGQLACGAGAL